MEIREALTQYGFDGDSAPIVTGSALYALEVEINAFHTVFTACSPVHMFSICWPIATGFLHHN